MTNEFESLFGNFLKASGASIETLMQVCSTLGLNPPADYLAVLQFTNGGEGFIGPSYFHLYSTEELLRLNEAYQVKRFVPGFIVFGSNGGGEAFGFDTRLEMIEIIQVPFIPLDYQYAIPHSKTFIEFLVTLAEAKSNSEAALPEINLSAFGKEVHEIHPIVFGGSPTDEKNKALVPPEVHAELSVFWNQIYQEKVYGRKF